MKKITLTLTLLLTLTTVVFSQKKTNKTIHDLMTDSLYNSMTYFCQEVIDDFTKTKITKKNVQLNITSDYLETENDVIKFLSKNDLNVYFYNPPHPYVGVGGSADLALSSQSGLVVNSSYMYRHFHNHLGYFEQHNSFKHFLQEKNKVINLYNLWTPDKMTEDYKKMIEVI